ncbi:hypothetical protein WJX79_000762 [Trebouxia sp. C0005]
MASKDFAAAHKAQRARLAAERQALLQQQSEIVQAKAKLAAQPAAALRFATPVKESRDKLVARLKDEQASQAARLEALKQARHQVSVTTDPTTEPAAAQPVAAAAGPAIHARRLGTLAAPPAVTAPREQLPYAEQDDDFVEFAKSLQRFPGDNLAGVSEDNLPGQPLTSQTAPLLPWDPGSPSPHAPTGRPPSKDEERFNLPHRRGAAFEPEPPERSSRPARLPSQDEEEEDEKLTFEAHFRRSVPDAAALRGTDLMEPLASRRPQHKGATGANQRLSNAPGLQQGMGQGPVKRPTPGGTTSMASQLKALGDLLNQGRSAQPSDVQAEAGDPELDPEEQEMQSLHDAHVKEMTKLRYELEQARTEAELAEMRNKIRLLQGEAPAGLTEPPGGPLSEGAPLDSLASSQTGQEDEEDQSLSSPQRRRFRPQEPDDEEQLQVQDRRSKYRRRLSSDSETDTMSRRSRSGKLRKKGRAGREDDAPDDLLPAGEEEAAGQDAVHIADIEAYKVKDLWLELEVMSPVSSAGSYSVTVVLYDGGEPVQAAGSPAGIKAQSQFKEVGTDEDEGQVKWRQQLCLSHVRLRSTSVAVLEVHYRPPSVEAAQEAAQEAGKSEVIAWAYTKIVQAGEVVTGLQSVPVYKLPLMLSAPRKFSWENAFIDFSMADHDTQAAAAADAKEAAMAAAAAESASGLGVKVVPAPKPKPAEDVPGVPTAAWARVKRGVPASDPFKPGAGFMLMVDGARFLPGNVTVSKVVGSVWSYDRQLLCSPFEALCSLDGDTLAPTYNCQVVLGAGAEQFNDPTATLLLQIDCIERDSLELRCVGYAVIPLFVDPREEAQPRRKNLLDYILNQGSWQIPLHMTGPSREDPTFHGASLKEASRVTCSSLLIRILSMGAARAALRRKTPAYADRAYDSSLDFPTATERHVYPSVLERPPLPMRTAIRPLLPASAFTPRLAPPGIGSGKLRSTPSGLPAAGLAKEGSALIRALSGLPKLGRWGKNRELAVLQPVLETTQGEEAGVDGEEAPPPAPLEEATLISDADMTQLMRDKLQRPELWNDVPLDYNRAWPYNKRLGFHVAIDAAARLPRSLPVAALFSLSPPGSFYSDLPQVESVGVTLQYDMGAPLHSPIWLDGYQFFQDVGYDSALSLIIDIRTVIPGSGTTAPVGWAALPLFQTGPGRYMASGYYQLPIFKGLPSRLLLDEMAAAKDVDTALIAALKAGRLKVVESHASVYVRVCDAQRMGSVEGPANEAGAQPFLRVPPYVQEGSRVQYDMQTVKTGGRTYDNARSKDISAEMWLEELNDAITRATGLDQLGLPQAPLDEEDLTEAELLEQQRVLAEDSAAAAPQPA